MNFEWKTEEEEDSAAARPESTSTNKNLATRRRLFLALMLVLLLSLAGVYGFLDYRAGQVANGVTTDVLAADRLIREATANEDIDLFVAMLAPARHSWRRQQIELFRHQLLFSRPSLRLWAQQNVPSPQTTLSPDFSQAEVVTLQPYTAETTITDRSETIILERTSFYRREDKGWLLGPAPQDEAYWGPWETIEGDQVDTIFPERDRRSGRRLAGDLASLVTEICQSPTVHCPDNFQLDLIFDYRLSALTQLNGNYLERQFSSGYAPYHLILPTPGLVGRPVDESGYQALYRGYASWLAAVLVNRYQSELPDRAGLDQIAERLEQWQLLPPPMPLLPGPIPSDADAGPPIPLPEQEILMICSSHTPIRWLAYDPAEDRWHEHAAGADLPALAQILAAVGPPTRFPPDGQGFLLRRRQPVPGASFWRGYLWLGGLDQVLTVNDVPDIFLADPLQALSDPAGRRLAFYPFRGDSQTPIRQTLILDTERCLAGDCRLQEVAGPIIWSPDGSRTLLVVVEPEQPAALYLGDEQGRLQHFLGTGYAPIWLDDNSFAWVRLAASGPGIVDGAAAEVVLMHLAANGVPNQLTTLFHNRRLAASLPSAVQVEDLVITTALPIPAHPDQWIIGVQLQDTAGVEEPADFMLMLDGQTGATNLVWNGPGVVALPVSLTDSGRFLSILTFDNTVSSDWGLTIVDLDRAAGSSLAGISRYETDAAYYEWSADEQWLMLAEEGMLRLIAPEHGYERQIPHRLGCHTTGWLRR